MTSILRVNEFGEEIPTIRDILSDDPMRDYIHKTLITILEHLKADDPQGVALAIIDDPCSGFGLKNYEPFAHWILKNAGVTEDKVKTALCGRAELIYRQIKPYVKVPKVIDIGCGDGAVGARLARDGLDITLTDVYKHQQIDSLRLPFLRSNQGQEIPTSERYNTALLLTVLHHSFDPLKTLDEAIKKTKDGGRIVVIESVYGVDPIVQDPTWGGVSRELTDCFKRLSKEQQRRATIFFDHFYNRLIHYSSNPEEKVSVPFNFRQPMRLMQPLELLEEGWRNIFHSKGLREVHFEYLGIDQPIVPEYHTLHVLDKE